MTLGNILVKQSLCLKPLASAHVLTLPNPKLLGYKHLFIYLYFAKAKQHCNVDNTRIAFLKQDCLKVSPILYHGHSYDCAGLHSGRQKRSRRSSAPGFWSLIWHAHMLVICQADVMSALNGCHLCSPTGFPCFSSWADPTDAFQGWVTGTESWNTAETREVVRLKGSGVPS